MPEPEAMLRPVQTRVPDAPSTSSRNRLANPPQLRLGDGVRPAQQAKRAKRATSRRGQQPATAALPPGEPEVLTPEDVAELLHIDRETVYRMARRHEIPAFKVGTKWRFRRASLRVWMQALEAQPD
jgi:excisionase family DNA binding protein